MTSAKVRSIDLLHVMMMRSREELKPDIPTPYLSPYRCGSMACHSQVSLMRRAVLCWCAALLVLGSPVLAAADNATARPHILFILADDLGFGDLGYTGSGIATPNIDALARNGTVMGHYYVMQCCSPTRAALMTGRYNIRYGLQHCMT